MAKVNITACVSNHRQLINLDQDLSESVENFGTDKASVRISKLHNGCSYLKAPFLL